MSYQRDAALELLKKFPKAAGNALARRLYKDNKALFPTFNAALCVIRKIRGAQGKYHRKRGMAVPELVDAIAKRVPVPGIPPAKRHFESWEAIKFPGPMRVLILSDIHIPYHNEHVVGLAIEHGKDFKADTILLNGDTADFFTVSRWEKDPRKRDFKGELDAVREFLTYLRGCFPRARIIFKVGNHEERYEIYMMVKAPELLDCAEFQIESLFWFDRLNIQCVKEKRPIRLGRLNVIHGHEYRFSISNPVNPARGFYLRAGVHVLGGHLHQTSQHSEKNLEEDVTSTWSTGCLCDLHPDYSPLNKWNHGFATVEVDNKGAFQVENYRIIHGKIW